MITEMGCLRFLEERLFDSGYLLLVLIIGIFGDLGHVCMVI